MKRLILIALVMTVVMALATGPAHAKMPIKIGFKGGVNVATVTGDDTEGFESRSGYVMGVFANLRLAKGLSFQPELLYSQKGAKGMATDGTLMYDITLEANYIEIPVLLKYGFQTNGPVKPFLIGGPAFASKKSSKTKVETTLMGLPFTGEVENFKEASTDLSFVLGGGVNIGMGRSLLSMEIRYTGGTKGMWEDVDVATAPNDEFPYYDPVTGKAFDMKNSTISLMVGLMF